MWSQTIFLRNGKAAGQRRGRNFFLHVQAGEAYRREYTSEQHFRRSVEEYIQFYNEVRPHQTLSFKTPQAFEENFQARFIEK